MRHPLVAGNWKMNGSSESINQLLRDIVSTAGNYPDVEVGVFPSSIYLNQVASLCTDSSVFFGAQMMSAHQSGAFTGEISPNMLVDVGASHVLIGHSERRSLFFETEADCAEKFKSAVDSQLLPILCLGETLQERNSEHTERVVASQLNAVLQLTGIGAFKNAIIAYEPVWAIGTGKTASPQQAQDVHQFIRNILSSSDDTIGHCVRIIYGGSVKPSNAAEIFSMQDIDGGLIGGASLDADDFAAIVSAAQETLRK